MSNVTNSNGLFLRRKNPNTVDNEGVEDRFLEILKKEHAQIPWVNTIPGVFMKNSWNFDLWSSFQLRNFHQQDVSHNFAEVAGVKAYFLEVPKVTYLKISGLFSEKFI